MMSDDDDQLARPVLTTGVTGALINLFPPTLFQLQSSGVPAFAAASIKLKRTHRRVRPADTPSMPASVAYNTAVSHI